MITKTKMATCDVCKREQEFEYGDRPSYWERILLHRRTGDNSHTLHFLDLCQPCQEIALDALEVP